MIRHEVEIERESVKVPGKRKIMVHVDWDDIQNGVKAAPTACPIARAIKEEFPKLSLLEVETDRVTFRKGNRNVEAALPDVAEEFVYQFDSGMPVKPFSFELEL